MTATSGPTDTVIGTMTQRRVNLQLNYSGHILAFLINMYMPNSSTPHPFANGVPNTGPYPILISGEEGWCTLISYNRQCAPTSQAGLQALVNRGYTIAEVNRDPFSLDPDGDGTYAQIYGSQLAACICTMWPWDGNGVTGYDWTAIYAWAWAYSRPIDYLETLSYIDKNHIGVIGVSRGAVASAAAGITDSRINLTVVVQPGGELFNRFMCGIDDATTTTMATSAGSKGGYYTQAGQTFAAHVPSGAQPYGYALDRPRSRSTSSLDIPQVAGASRDPNFVRGWRRRCSRRAENDRPR